MSPGSPVNGYGKFSIARAAACLGLALALAGCVSTGGSGGPVSSAATGAVASSEPLMLNTGPAPGSAPVVAADKTTAPAADATPAVAPASEPVPRTVTSATPAVTTDNAAAPAQPAAVASTPAPSSTDDSISAGFPNVNAPPEQPSGKLLSPEERAKMIAELEALKQRQHGPAPSDASTLPAKCANKKVAAIDPDCKPAPTN